MFLQGSQRGLRDSLMRVFLELLQALLEFTVSFNESCLGYDAPGKLARNVEGLHHCQHHTCGLLNRTCATTYPSTPKPQNPIGPIDPYTKPLPHKPASNHRVPSVRCRFQQSPQKLFMIRASYSTMKEIKSYPKSKPRSAFERVSV